MHFYISPEICPQNHACPLVLECPASAIRQKDKGLPIIDERECIKCGLCFRSCKMHAVVKQED